MWLPQVTLAQVKEVNTAVNALPYLKELQDDWRPIDQWGGDCDSYASRKALDLFNLGMPVTDMRFATCKDEKGGDHCVLLVEHDGATLVLDNRYPLPMAHDLVPYTWVKLQIAGTNQFEWA